MRINKNTLVRIIIIILYVDRVRILSVVHSSWRTIIFISIIKKNYNKIKYALRINRKYVEKEENKAGSIPYRGYGDDDFFCISKPVVFTPRT